MHYSEHSLEITLSSLVFVNKEVIATHCIPRNCLLGINVDLYTSKLATLFHIARTPYSR